MYTFDVSEETATTTYHEVCDAYESIFHTLGLPVSKVSAATGNIGGTLSHEYHVISSVGEDTLVLCHRCGKGSNKELVSTKDILEHGHLPDCTSDCQLDEVKGIEVAHAFYLGTKYSTMFGASFFDQNNTEKLCEMGCFGVGISRLLQATLEHSCSVNGDDDRISWPLTITPFTVCVLPLTTSQDPNDSLMICAQQLYDGLYEQACPDRVILDDRTHLSMGARLRDSYQLGYPCTVIISQKTPDDMYEVRLQGHTSDEMETHLLTESQVIQTVRELYTCSKTLTF